MQLAPRFVSLALGPPVPRVRSVPSRGAVLVRAKEVREYREDSDEVIVASEKKDKVLYADQVKMVSVWLIYTRRTLWGARGASQAVGWWGRGHRC